MSRENVEAFLAGVEAINRGDVESLLAGLSEAVLFLPLRSAVEGGYRGHEGVRRFLADNEQAFELFKASYEDVYDLGDRVVAVGTVRVRGRGGAETTVPTAGIATFRDGQMTMWEDYGDAAEALAAAGLPGSATIAGAHEAIVRRFVWAFEHDADLLRELAHPDIEWAPFEENHTVFYGIEGAMMIRKGWLEAWAEHRIDIEDVAETGDELVFTMHLVARGKGSGLEAEVRIYPHVKLIDGKVAYVFEYDNRADALAALGLAHPS